MPKADISSDHGGMLALREAFELLHELPDVLRLNHPGCEEITLPFLWSISMSDDKDKKR